MMKQRAFLPATRRCTVIIILAIFFLVLKSTNAFQTIHQIKRIQVYSNNKKLTKHHHYNRLLANNKERSLLLYSTLDDSTTTTTTEKKKRFNDDNNKVPTTLKEAIHRFFGGPEHGPRSCLLLLSIFIIWRTLSFPFGFIDLFAFIFSISFWWIQEYIMHKTLLHSDWDWMGKSIHEQHHQSPYYHISIDPAWLMISWLLVAHFLLQIILFPSSLALSATIGYTTAGLFYEWSHYIVHTRVKPNNILWKRMKDNHMKHHCVDRKNWFSFSIPVMDDFFGTNPKLKEVVRKQKEEEETT